MKPVYISGYAMFKDGKIDVANVASETGEKIVLFPGQMRTDAIALFNWATGEGRPSDDEVAAIKQRLFPDRC